MFSHHLKFLHYTKLKELSSDFGQTFIIYYSYTFLKKRISCRYYVSSPLSKISQEEGVFLQNYHTIFTLRKLHIDINTILLSDTQSIFRFLHGSQLYLCGHFYYCYLIQDLIKDHALGLVVMTL